MECGPPRARLEASIFRLTREAYLEHENANAELKALMPNVCRQMMASLARELLAASTPLQITSSGLTLREL